MGCCREEAEPRGHPGFELERRLQEEALHRPALVVVVGRRTALGREPNGAHLPALVHELCRENGTVAGQLAFARMPLHQQPEAVARLQVGVEVDLAGEHIGQSQRQVNPLARLVERGRQRVGVAIDGALHHHDRRLLGNAFDRRVEPGVPVERSAGRREPAVGVNLVLEPAHAAVEQAIDEVGLAGADAPQVERAANRRDQHRLLRPINHVMVEHRGNGRARGDESGQVVGIAFERDIGIEPRHRHRVGRRHWPKRRGGGAHKQGDSRYQKAFTHERDGRS